MTLEQTRNNPTIRETINLGKKKYQIISARYMALFTTGIEKVCFRPRLIGSLAVEKVQQVLTPESGIPSLQHLEHRN